MRAPVLAVLAIINVLAFILYGVDKYRAKTHGWRIPEKTLLGIAVVGGSIGATLGMFVFRHKTRHWYFRYGVPLILILQCVAVGLAWGRFH